MTDQISVDVPLDYATALLEIGRLRTELKNAERYAELTEFLLFIRDDVANFEKNYCPELPSKDEFVHEIGSRYPIFLSQIRDNINFRNWLWMLVAGDGNQCHSIEHLREALRYDINVYLWFSKQMEIFYSVLSNEVHTKSPLLNIQFMKREKFLHYTKFFNADLRSAVEIFIQARDKV